MESKKKKRISAKKVKEAIQFCIKRDCHDGIRCNICKRFMSEDQIRLDHKDNNPENNPKDGSNWQIVCARDNYLKNPGGRRKRNIQDPSVIERPRETSAEMEKNRRSEPAFRSWLYDYLRTNRRIEEDTAIHAGAEKAHCSTITVKRYLVKCCSMFGFAFVDYDESADRNFIYLRTKNLQPVDASLLNEFEGVKA